MEIETTGRGAARIGKTGTKLHAAVKIRVTEDDGKTRESWRVTCGCGATGRARPRFYENVAPNCGNSVNHVTPPAAPTR